MSPIELRRGDILRLRRPHPCGNDRFEVVRLGADIGLTCTRCGRRVLLARSLLERRMAGFVSRGSDPQPPADLDLGGPGRPRGSGSPGDAAPGDEPPPEARRPEGTAPDGRESAPLDPPRPAP